MTRVLAESNNIIEIFVFPIMSIPKLSGFGKEFHLCSYERRNLINTNETTIMLEKFTPWNPDVVTRYTAAGYWENRTITDMVYATAQQYPEKVALIEGERRITYGELHKHVERLAYLLLGRGIGNSDRVVMQLPNSIEFVFSYLALTRIGAIPVMALMGHRQTEIHHFVSSSGSVAYMISGEYHRFDYRQMAKAVTQVCPTLKTILVLGDPLIGQVSLRRLIEEDVPSTEVSAGLADIRPNPLDVVTMLLLRWYHLHVEVDSTHSQ